MKEETELVSKGGAGCMRRGRTREHEAERAPPNDHPPFFPSTPSPSFPSFYRRLSLHHPLPHTPPKMADQGALPLRMRQPAGQRASKSADDVGCPLFLSALSHLRQHRSLRPGRDEPLWVSSSSCLLSLSDSGLPVSHVAIAPGRSPGPPRRYSFPP